MRQLSYFALLVLCADYKSLLEIARLANNSWMLWHPQARNWWLCEKAEISLAPVSCPPNSWERKARWKDAAASTRLSGSITQVYFQRTVLIVTEPSSALRYNLHAIIQFHGELQ